MGGIVSWRVGGGVGAGAAPKLRVKSRGGVAEVDVPIAPEEIRARAVIRHGLIRENGVGWSRIRQSGGDVDEREMPARREGRCGR